ncbi:MAG: hypothetical protein ACREFK_02180 [Stellaceae bacterium]
MQNMRAAPTAQLDSDPDILRAPFLWPGCPITKADLRRVRDIREALLAGGYRPLAIHSPWSISAGDAAGKAPLVEMDGGGKLNWRATPHSREKLLRVTRAGANTGLLLGGDAALVAFDLDPAKGAGAAEQQKFTLAVLRQLYAAAPTLRAALLRLRAPASALILLRADRPMTKIKVAGAHGAVELLGEGQQFVCDGWHPLSRRGAPVRWVWRGECPPWGVPVAALPVTSADEVVALMRRLADSGVLGAPLVRPAAATPPRANFQRMVAYPATARLHVLFDHFNGLVKPAVRALIEEIGTEGSGRHDALVAICGRLVMQHWSDAAALDFLAPLVNAHFKEGDWTGEVEAAMRHARTRQTARLQGERGILWSHH